MSNKRTKVVVKIVAILVILMAVSIVVTTPAGSKILVKDGPSVISKNTSDESRKGFEVIDLRTKKVWLTADFTTEEFKALKVPLLWKKMDSVREACFDNSKFLKSPGCKEGGNYNESLMFGREFLHVCKIKEFPKYLDESKLIYITILEKYHEVTFNSGRTIRVLVCPEGKQYIMMTRDLDRTKDIPELPDGWELKEGRLSQDLTVVLSGRNEIIRTDNNDSFQGPLDKNFDINKHI